MFITILAFILVLSVLVLVHEFGHFFVAKKLGVKVEEFGFGFPPRIFGKKIGETLYSINLLPIGGFVKLYGEDEAGAGKIGSVRSNALQAKGKNLKRAFFARPVWQRALIVVAGVVMNFLLAVVIISYLFAVVGVGEPGNKVIVASVEKNSPAYIAGLQVSDTIVSVNNIKLTSPDQLVAFTKAHLGQELLLVVENDKHALRIVAVTPRVHYKASEGAMGVAIVPNIEIKKYSWYKAPLVGLLESLKESWMILKGLETAVVQLVVGGKVPQGIAGPVGIAELTGQTVKIGFSAVLSLISLLSLNLAIMNVLPIPALDGGRLFFILIEGVTRKKVNTKLEGYIHTIGMIFLFGLIFLITFNDIIKVVTHQPLLPQ